MCKRRGEIKHEGQSVQLEKDQKSTRGETTSSPKGKRERKIKRKNNEEMTKRTRSMLENRANVMFFCTSLILKGERSVEDVIGQSLAWT